MKKIILGLFIFSSISTKFILCQELWTPTSLNNAPSSRDQHTAVWTGTLMIIWGGMGLGSGYDNTGGIYNPITDSWTVTSTANAPSGRLLHTAVWTGSKMVVWGGMNSSFALENTGGIYDPAADSWIATTTSNAPTGRWEHTAVWTGNRMIIWGGFTTISDDENTGGIFDPVANSWTPTSTVNAPDKRDTHTAVWTGSALGGKMIIWGGLGETGYENTGGIYDPVANSWTATSTTNAPAARYAHTAVWTGSKMIIWGGFSNSYQNTGGVYDPVANSWTPTSTVNAPSPRYYQSAIWANFGTSQKMIVWGGLSSSGYENSGGIYDPVSNTWTPLSTVNAPTGRYKLTSIWTGTEMIVWGGYGSGFLNTGGIYLNDSLVGVANQNQPFPTGYKLYQNYPNPFNPTTKIKFATTLNPPEGGTYVQLIIYDILGREVTTLINEKLNPGTYEIEWNAGNYPSGVYFYKLTSNNFSETKKLVLLK